MEALRSLVVAVGIAGALHQAGGPQPSMPQDIEPLVRAFDGEVGLYALDLASRREIAINADRRFPTASTIKTAVMVEAYHQAADGKLSLDDAMTLTDGEKVGGSGVLNGLSA